MESLHQAVTALDEAASMRRGPGAAQAVAERLGTVLRLVLNDTDGDDPALSASARVTAEDLKVVVSTAQGARWMAESVLDVYAEDRAGERPDPAGQHAAAIDEMWGALSMDLETVRSFLAPLLNDPADRPGTCAGQDGLAARVKGLLAAGPGDLGRGPSGRLRRAGWDECAAEVLSLLDTDPGRDVDPYPA